MERGDDMASFGNGIPPLITLFPVRRGAFYFSSFDTADRSSKNLRRLSWRFFHFSNVGLKKAL